jgi:toxin ParE1/3/4
MTRVSVSPRAQQDLRRAARDYGLQNPDLVAPFYAAVHRALAFISDNPGAGSPRYAHLMPGTELRTWQIENFPYLLFYQRRADGIDIVRALHAHRDIPSILRDPR